jgi:hypothetical protein
MRTLLFLFAFIVLPVFLFAQTEIQPKKQNAERYNQFKISPKFKPQPDSLFFSDTLPGNPEFSFTPEIVPQKETYDPFRMPVFKVNPDFPSNMPIYVPDSSVHYYIKQAMPVQSPSEKK